MQTGSRRSSHHLVLVYRAGERDAPHPIVEQAQAAGWNVRMLSTDRITDHHDGIAGSAEEEAAILSPDVPNPLEVARFLHDAAPWMPIVLISRPDRVAEIRRALDRDGCDTPCTVITTEQPLATAVEQATRQGRTEQVEAREDYRMFDDAGEPGQALASVLTHAQAAIALLDADATVRTWSRGAERLFDITAAQAIGRPLLGLLDWPPQMQRLLQAATAGRAGAAELACELAGRPVHLEVRLDPVLDSSGRAVGMTAIINELSETQHVQAQRRQLLDSEREARRVAEQAIRLRDEFLASLSHELRTPLNAIMGWVQLLQTMNLEPGELEQGLATIERNARAQARIVEDLLDMSRITTGSIQLRISPVDLRTVIDEAVEQIRPAVIAKRIELETQLPAEAPRVFGDRGRLRQVCWNLLTNAVKFTPAGGRVRVVLEEGHDQLRLHVSDSGQGIEPQFLPHVFERFRQADGSTTRVHGGLGLGLAIVKQLVELHGGTVRASSEGPGRGATFTVSLPARRD